MYSSRTGAGGTGAPSYWFIDGHGSCLPTLVYRKTDHLPSSNVVKDWGPLLTHRQEDRDTLTLRTGIILHCCIWGQGSSVLVRNGQSPLTLEDLRPLLVLNDIPAVLYTFLQIFCQFCSFFAFFVLYFRLWKPLPSCSSVREDPCPSRYQ